MTVADRPWRIRPATPDDASAIAEVARAGWRATYRGIIAPAGIERFLAGAYADASVARRIATADLFEVAEADGAVIGFAEWVRRDRDANVVAELVATYLLAAWQRRGIGRAFHARALERYGGTVGTLVTHVLRENHGARAYYRAMGFTRESPATFELFGESVAELRLELPLANGPAGAGPAPGPAPGPGRAGYPA